MCGRCGDCKQLFKPNERAGKLAVPEDKTPGPAALGRISLSLLKRIQCSKPNLFRVRLKRRMACEFWWPAGAAVACRPIVSTSGWRTSDRAKSCATRSWAASLVERIQPPLFQGATRRRRSRCSQQTNQESRAEVHPAAAPASGSEADHHVALPLRGRRAALPSPFVEGVAREKDLAARELVWREDQALYSPPAGERFDDFR